MDPAPHDSTPPATRAELFAARAELSAARWRIATGLTVAMLVAYFGFIVLVAYARPLMGTVIVPGLSVGIALGATVIAAAWGLTGIYVRWANRRYDAGVIALREASERADGAP